MQRVTRHVVLFLTCVVPGVALYATLAPAEPAWRVSMASGYESLVLLALTLMIGPWNRLRRLPNPVSGYLRRDIGIWAGVTAIVHVVFGLQVHFTGRMWLYFVAPPDASYRFPLRIDPFGLTNWVGLAATLIVLLLLCLSNDASLRALGARRWKALQRWNYAGAALVIAHGVVYMIIEKRQLGFIGVFAAVVLAAIALQLAGFRLVKRKAR